MRNSKHTTIEDIARAVGVSTATVSRAFSGSPRVGVDTRERVLRIARQMHYEPSNLARALSTRRTSTIGVVVEDIANPFFVEVAKGIERVCEAENNTMLIASSDWQLEKESKILRKLLRQRVDGVIVATIDPDSEANRQLKASGMPMVLLNWLCIDGSVSSVSTDNREGGMLAARHSLARAVDRVVCLVGFPHQSSFDRLEGFMSVVTMENPRRVPHELYRGVHTAADGYDVVPRLLADAAGARLGVCACNDLVAMGVIEGLLDHGIRVPDRICVCGYDDIAFAGKFRVPLTTVAQPMRQMGDLAANELFRLIREPQSPPRQLVLPPRLVVRESCPAVPPAVPG